MESADDHHALSRNPVIDVTTYRPLPGVHINMNTGALDAYGAISDRNGRFSIARIPPDDYFLSAQRKG